MQTPIERVELALEDLRQGKMIVLTDDPDRENEGDLIVAAEHITNESMNFMIRNGSGIVCVAATSDFLKKLDLPLMVSHDDNTSARGTPFTISVDAKHGITTGVSASDRVQTIKTMLNKNTTPDCLVKPGHIFPLQAKDNGVLERQGHTEGAVDLLKSAGCQPVAVLCEIMNVDGTMMRGGQLVRFAQESQLTILSIEDILAYRFYHEHMIFDEAVASFPSEHYGDFKISVVKEKINHREHVILSKNNPDHSVSTLVRIHSSCLTGDLFASKRCDCHHQLHYSLKKISEEGGVLIYMDQEGRGVGLFNKIRAYALQEQGYDTVEANEKLGLPIDAREYYIAANILRKLNLNDIRLLTNNPHKINNLKKYGLMNVIREPMPSFEHPHNQFYLRTKKQKLKHLNDLDLVLEGKNG